MKPTNEQMNKRLAIFDGYKHDDTDYDRIVLDGRYTEKIEWCVPLVEKLGVSLNLRYFPSLGIPWVVFNNGRAMGAAKSPSLALATAIYKVLIEREEAK